MAAISATVASGYLAFYFRGHQERSGIALLACTLLGLAASFGISRVPAANPARKFNRNPLGDLGEQIRVIRGDRVLCWAVVGNFYLWFLAALLQFTIVIYGHDILRIDERHISYLQAAVAIGIGLGSLATGYLSDAKIEYGLIPVGAVGMTVFGFLSASHGISLERAAVYLGLLGFFGGFYAVPLNALIQHRPDPARKGGVIAAANLISFVGVFAAAGVYFALAEGLRLRADEIFFAGRLHDAGGDVLCRGVPARFGVAPGAVDSDAQRLPHSRGGPRQYSRARRRALRRERSDAARGDFSRRGDGPADPIRGRCEAIRAHGAADPQGVANHARSLKSDEANGFSRSRLDGIRFGRSGMPGGRSRERPAGSSGVASAGWKDT